MGHIEHTNAEGLHIPSVSEIPNIFAKDMRGFQSWICKQLHNKETHCCAKAAQDYYEEAADLGHDIHALREAFLRGESFSEGVPEYQAALFDPIARFYKESGYKPLLIEEAMTGVEFGGSLDGCGKFSFPFWDNERRTFWDKPSRGAIDTFITPTTDSVWVEDLKIKSKIDPLHPLQLYGYRLLLQETKGIIADWGLIIRREKKLDKRPEIQLRGYYLPAYKNQWDASLLMWKFLNEKD